MNFQIDAIDFKLFGAGLFLLSRGMKSVTCITGVGLCHVMKCISVIGCEAVIVERPLV